MSTGFGARRWLRAGIAMGLMALAGLVGGCGGGGGGGSDDDGLRIRVNPASVTITVERGSASPAAQVTATLEGRLPTSPVYVGTEADHAGLLNVELNFPDSRTAVATIRANSSATAGTYNGTLRFLVCKDAYCTGQYTAPVSVGYAITVLPGFDLSPAALDLAATAGQTTRTRVQVQLPPGASDYSADADTLPAWLSVSERSASGLTLSTAAMPSGSYSAFLGLTASNGRRIVLPLSLRLAPPATGEHNLLLSQPSFDLATVEGSSTTASLGVSPPTWAPALSAAVQYTAGNGSGWLTLQPVSGGYTLQANAASLAAGAYQALVRISGDAYTQAQTVYVSLTVGAGLTQVAARQVTVQAETGAEALAGTVVVQLAGGTPRRWSASSDSPWLVLDTASGNTGGTLAWHIDRSRLEALANASSQTAQVTVTVGAPVTPMTFAFTLNKALAAPGYAMPATRLVSQGGTLYLRGSGFAAMTSPAARVSVDGVAGVSVSRINDSELALTWPGAAAGSYTVRISNALGLTTATTQVQVLPAASLPPVRIAQNGQKTGVIHDVARRALLVLNREAGAIQRYAYGSGSWVQSSASLAALAAFALSPDGATLVATTADGQLHLLDPASLAVRESYRHTAPFYQWAAIDANLPVTNDGKVWLAAGSGWNELVSFDLVSRRFAAAPLNGLSTSFYFGPWGLVSGDGERLLLTQTSGLSPCIFKPRTGPGSPKRLWASC